MTELPSIDWEEAIKVGTALVPVGTPPRKQQLEKLVAELHQAADRAVGLIREVSGLELTGDVPELVLDRKDMVRANLLSLESIFSNYPQLSGTIFGQTSAKLKGAAIGAVFALLIPRVVGQYDAYGKRPALLLNAPTIYEIETQLMVEPSDFRLWVVLHEQTHRVQFANAGWLKSYILDLFGVILEDSSAIFADAEHVIAAARRVKFDPDRTDSLQLASEVLSEPAADALAQVNTAMSVIEGHADVMMDAVGTEVIPTLKVIRKRFQARRDRGGVVALINKLTGMDTKLAQYKNGAKFCQAVIDQRGVAGLNKVWESAENLPSEAELYAPQDWIDRVLGKEVN